MLNSEPTITGDDIQKIRLDIGLRSARLADALGIDLAEQLRVERQGPNASYLRRLLMAHRAGDLPSARLICLVSRIEETIRLSGEAKSPFSLTGDKVRKARLLLRLSQEDLASLVGVTPPMISQIERGHRKPQEYIVRELATLLTERLKPEVDLDEFLNTTHPAPLKRGPRSATKAPTPQ